MSSTHQAVAELADVLKVVALGVARTADAYVMQTQIDRCDRVINDMLVADAKDGSDG